MSKKSFLGSLISTAAKAGDKAIRQATKERERKAKEAEKLRIKAESNKMTYEKELRERQRINDLLNRGYLIMPIKSFDKYMKGAILEDHINDQITDAIISGKKTIAVHSSSIQDMDRKYAEYLIKEKTMHKCAELNNKGIAYEKEGEIKLAINTYKKNIQSDYPAHHSFKRLMILYRKDKDYDNEYRVILRALEVFPTWNEYINRLSKVKQLINNNYNL
jgi:tetratricopeptide (TPR) repeat protein